MFLITFRLNAKILWHVDFTIFFYFGFQTGDRNNTLIEFYNLCTKGVQKCQISNMSFEKSKTIGSDMNSSFKINAQI